MTLKENMIKLLRKIMAANSLTEVAILEDMQRSVLWYDNAGFPNEDFIVKLTWDGEELGYVLSTPDHITVCEDDTAFEDEEAMHDVLGSVLMTIGGIPKDTYSNSCGMIEELFVGILENTISQSSAHRLVMELSSDIAAKKLTLRHNQPFGYFVEAGTDDPVCTHYKEEFQVEVNKLYGQAFERLCNLFGTGVGAAGMIVWESMTDENAHSDGTPISMKELTEAVHQLGINGGGSMEITGTWRGKPRSIWVEQTEWHGTPVCLVGGNGNEVSSLHPRDVPFVVDCVFGNYLDGELFIINNR